MDTHPVKFLNMTMIQDMIMKTKEVKHKSINTRQTMKAQGVMSKTQELKHKHKIIVLENKSDKEELDKTVLRQKIEEILQPR